MYLCNPKVEGLWDPQSIYIAAGNLPISFIWVLCKLSLEIWAPVLKKTFEKYWSLLQGWLKLQVSEAKLLGNPWNKLWGVQGNSDANKPIISI